MKNKTKSFILFFISSFILIRCSPYPSCPKESTCTTISAEKPITIPFILPLTSQNAALIEEQKDAILLAFLHSKLEPDTYQLEFFDNYDLQINNQRQINSQLENPTTPLIVSSLSSKSKNEPSLNANDFSTLDIGKTTNSLFTLPGINDYIQQAINTLSNDLDLSNGQTIFFTSYFHYETLKSSSFCSQPNMDCSPFDMLLFDQTIQDKANTAHVMILASNQQDLEDWLDQIPLISNQKIILLDTDFHMPFFIPHPPKTMYWLLPSLWFEEKDSPLQVINQQKWKSAFSYWTYNLTQQIFEILETNISSPKSGFRLIFTSQLKEALPNQINPPEVLFKLYQFSNSQFIIKNNNH